MLTLDTCGHISSSWAPLSKLDSDVDILQQEVCEKESSLHMSKTQSYMLNLKSHNAIFIGGQTGHVMMLKDFDFEKDRLHHQKYVIVERQARLFRNGHRQWVYWCTCNQNNSKEMSTLNSNINMLYADFIKIYPNCCHIETSCMFMEKYYAENDIEPDETVNKDIVSEDEHNYANHCEIMEISKDLLLCSIINGDYGLVNKNLNCLTCAKVNKCDHTELCLSFKNDPQNPLFEVVSNFLQDDINVIKGNKKTKQTTTVISFKKIPYERTETLANGLRGLNSIPTDLLPDIEACQSCGSRLETGDPIANGWLAYNRSLIVTNSCYKHANTQNHVIYNNVCKLHQYCLSRDPIFFKDTQFFVDRLHWYNNSSCCYGYELSLYPQFEHINSQCNEQANSGLKRIKDQLFYMTASNFMTHCALYLKNLNKKKINQV